MATILKNHTEAIAVWNQAATGAVYRHCRKHKPVTAETLSQNRKAQLEQYHNKNFESLCFIGENKHRAVFTEYQAHIHVDEYNRDDPRCYLPVEVPAYEYSTDLRIERSRRDIENALADFCAPSLEAIFPWKAAAINQLRSALIAFDDFDRQLEYEARFCSLSNEEVADQIRRNEDLSFDEQRLPLKFMFRKFRESEEHKRLARFYENIKGYRNGQLSWGTLQKDLEASPINAALWEVSLAEALQRRPALREIINSFWQTAIGGNKTEQSDFIVKANLEWFGSSPQFIGALWREAPFFRWQHGDVILQSAERLLKSVNPNVQTGLLSALPVMCSKLDAGYMTGLIEPNNHSQLERRVFLELPLALADNPADEEVGGQAKKTCAAIRSTVAKDLEQKRKHSQDNIATTKAEISRLEVRVEQYQEEIARISSVEKTLAAFFGPEAPAVDKQATLNEFSTPKGLG